MIDTFTWLSIALGALLLLLDAVARWQCRKHGCIWRKEFHPVTGLLQARCRRCRRWPDAS